ncbi:importin subunit alpha-1 isoform X1 [Patella vulgata]|uniref:importin subunit alpha-1 isoform X1 n=1 Tax=Patella vulgata TaxID=6465 RepID=UPI00217F4DDC|nr:importin subunit alpha-1 isoform X1 [Patella vulgata]
MPSEESVRLRDYKNQGRSADEMRRRRNQTTIELRKARKDDQLLKRRNCAIDENEPQILHEISKQNVTMPLPDIISAIQGSDLQQQMMATQAVRKVLSKERNPPINDIIQANLVPRLKEFLSHSDRPELQFEAAWALTNIASGTSDQTRYVVNEGAVVDFIKLLDSPHQNVCEQAVWALGNIAGDGPELRDHVTMAGIVDPLLRLARIDVPAAFLRNVTWTISNLCRNKNPPPKFEVVKQCLPTLARLLHHSDKEVLADTCWALSYLTDGSNDKIQEVIDANVIPRLVELLGSAEASVLTPALRSIGNIVTGDDHQTQAVLEANALPAFTRLLNHPKINIQKEAAWTLSNITAGNSEQIQAVINQNLIPPILLILKQGDFKSQKEAVWAITNLTSGGTVEQIAYLVQAGAVPLLCGLLGVRESKVILVILDALCNILRTAEKIGEHEKISEIIEECGGVDSVEALQNHENEQVYKSALEIIEKYFGGEEEDENIAPTASGDNTGYQFNAASTIPTQGFSF